MNSKELMRRRKSTFAMPARLLQDAADDGLLEAPLRDLDAEATACAEAGARGAVDALMVTDAPLLFPPSHLALAALRAGLKKV